MTEQPSFVAGDTGSKFRLTCKDNGTKSPIDLTGATVQLQWRTRKGAFIEKDVAVVDEINGVVEYKFAAAELEAGVMQFEVEIVDALGNKIRNLDLLSELVREAL